MKMTASKSRRHFFPFPHMNKEKLLCVTLALPALKHKTNQSIIKKGIFSASSQRKANKVISSSWPPLFYSSPWAKLSHRLDRAVSTCRLTVPGYITQTPKLSRDVHPTLRKVWFHFHESCLLNLLHVFVLIYTGWQLTGCQLMNLFVIMLELCQGGRCCNLSLFFICCAESQAWQYAAVHVCVCLLVFHPGETGTAVKDFSPSIR